MKDIFRSIEIDYYIEGFGGIDGWGDVIENDPGFAPKGGPKF